MKLVLDMGEFKILLYGVNIEDGTFVSALYDRKNGDKPFEITGKDGHIKYSIIGAAECLKEVADNLRLIFKEDVA